jgi:hypothetical protein
MFLILALFWRFDIFEKVRFFKEEDEDVEEDMEEGDKYGLAEEVELREVDLKMT